MHTHFVAGSVSVLTVNGALSSLVSVLTVNVIVLGSLFSSSLFPNRAPIGEVTITSYIGGARAPALAARSTEELVEITAKDLSAILGIRAQPTFARVTVFPHAIPQYNVGFASFKDLMSGIESRSPGLFLAGHAREGISLSDCIVSGGNAAARIDASLAAASSPRTASSVQLVA